MMYACVCIEFVKLVYACVCVIVYHCATIMKNICMMYACVCIVFNEARVCMCMHKLYIDVAHCL